MNLKTYVYVSGGKKFLFFETFGVQNNPMKKTWNLHFQSTLLCIEHFTLKLLIINGHLVTQAGWMDSRQYIYWYIWSTNSHYGCKPYPQNQVLHSTSCCVNIHLFEWSALLLVSLVEKRCSSNRMFKYWMLIMKFLIDYLVFVRSVREHNFFCQNSDISS